MLDASQATMPQLDGSRQVVPAVLSTLRHEEHTSLEAQCEHRSPRTTFCNFSLNRTWTTELPSSSMGETQQHLGIIRTRSDPIDRTYATIIGRTELAHDRRTAKTLWAGSVRVGLPKGLQTSPACCIKGVRRLAWGDCS